MQINSVTLQPKGDIFIQRILIFVCCTKHNEVNTEFSYVPRHVFNRKWDEQY